MDNQPWFYLLQGQSVGPVSLETLCDGLQSGRIPASAVWSPGMESWKEPSEALDNLKRLRRAKADSLGRWSGALGALAAGSAVIIANPLGPLVFPLSVVGLVVGLRAWRNGSAKGKSGATICAIVLTFYVVEVILLLAVWMLNRVR